MKKLFALLLVLILLTGCSGEKEASADITPTATIESTQNVDGAKHTDAPTPTSTPTPLPDASATHQILFNKPNIQLHGRNWQISNYYFRSQSGVVEKKKSDFDTVEAFDKHIIEQCEQKYSGIVKHLNTHRDEIEAIYVHITLIVAQYCGDHHFAKMDAMITNKELINKWIDAYVNLPIKVNKEYSSVDADVPTGTRNHIMYCIETTYGEIIEVYDTDGYIPYWEGVNGVSVPLFEAVYVPESAWDSEPVKNMRSVNQAIYDAAYKRFEAVYTQPEYYPYLIE